MRLMLYCESCKAMRKHICESCKATRKHIAVDWGKAFCKTCRQMRDNPKARQHSEEKESKT